MAQRGGSNGLLPTHEKVPLHPLLRNPRIEVPRNLNNSRVFGRTKNRTVRVRSRSMLQAQANPTMVRKNSLRKLGT